MHHEIRFGGSAEAPLLADLYCPEGPGPHPLVIAVCGGGWVRGHRRSLAQWGRHLADRGLALASIDYRKSDRGVAFPGNAEDVAGALRHFSQQGGALGLDPARIALLGVSAGAHLAALVTLSKAFDVPRPRALACIYGVYDLVAHWQSDLIGHARPGTDRTERMLGATPYDDPQLYHDASPLRQITYETALPSLFVWGHQDRVIQPAQSAAMALAMRQAGAMVRVLELPDADHFWFSEEDLSDPTSHSARVAGPLTRFLRQQLEVALP
ncbi:alpha/beta hydrolase fold domain-containing protein [Pseudooceanicola sp. GBMRC 2024]|uniref:Alpha/beta hydrolase fold domain-containing protein n=1 Tax=Pseudooceanicola albus TaxID=2692189 RepID=A0A6L7G3E5_9RHOB|nr:alpha/beta hydrolase [Pseudooceanicola albus]MXN17900.1 alpha/beta hydrolase fold domain-containing protein [Pseudooceanicola albus]